MAWLRFDGSTVRHHVYLNPDNTVLKTKCGRSYSRNEIRDPLKHLPDAQCAHCLHAMGYGKPKRRES